MNQKLRLYSDLLFVIGPLDITVETLVPVDAVYLYINNDCINKDLSPPFSFRFYQQKTMMKTSISIHAIRYNNSVNQIALNESIFCLLDEMNYFLHHKNHSCYQDLLDRIKQLNLMCFDLCYETSFSLVYFGFFFDEKSFWSE